MPIRCGLWLMLLAGFDAALAAPDPAAVEPNVARIITSEGDGTGFWLADADLLVTNHRVIANADSIAVAVPPEAALRSARVLKESAGYDIALLAVEGLVRPGLALAAGIDKGQAVWAMGFPQAADRGRSERSTRATLTAGTVNRLLSQAWQDSGPVLALVQHDAEIDQGNSGGPLLDACGRVAGVNIEAGDDGPALASSQYALSVVDLRALLERWGIRYRSAEGGCSLGGEPAGTSAGPWLVGLAAAAAILALALRGLRQRIIRLVQSYGRSLRRLQPSRAQVAAATPVSTAAILTLARDGETPRTIRCPADRPCEQVIGRSAVLCDLALDEDTVSRRHVRVFWQPRQKQWYVEDLNSSNGTQLDGFSLKPYIPTPLRQGARLTLGEIQLIVSKQP